MEILNYTSENQEVCAAIWLTSSIAAHPFMAEDVWVQRYSKVYHEMLPSLQTLVAWQDGAVESFLSVAEDGEIAFLNTAVCFQKKGHGQALLTQAKQLHPQRLWARVYVENERAVNFFQKNGFILEKEETDGSDHQLAILVWQG